MKRGEIWWADLAEPPGLEPAKRRPVLIIQDDALTRSRLQTIMVVPLTSNLKRALAPGNLLLTKAQTRLPSESVALGCQILTVGKAFFSGHASTLPPAVMARIDEALRLTLSLS